MARTWRHAVVVGASSGIGAAIARRLVATGCTVALVARRRAELEQLAAELNGARSDLASVYVHDVTRGDEVPALFDRIAAAGGGLDLLVYSAGTMPRIDPGENSYTKDRTIIDVNVLGAMAWVNEAARRFAAARAGTIVGLSSVAGDRGRRDNPAYCASKAALDTYLEAVRNRVGRHGVDVVTAKPGPVATPMTAGVERTPFIIPADEAARQILAGAARGARVVYVPGRWRPIMFVIRHIPSRLFRRLDI